MKEHCAVLIIEDNQDDLFFLREVLTSTEELSADIMHAQRLDSGIAMARTNHLDVAIIDLSLPDSVGLDTFLSFHKAYPTIPKIIMTGARDRDMAYTALRNGAQDYLFKGEPSANAVVRTIRFAIERQRLMTELQQALEHVKQLQGLLPICSICKDIRDDQGYWGQIENYISRHSEIRFSHGLCPRCARKHYPDIFPQTE